jgi:hypothetical protein
VRIEIENLDAVTAALVKYGKTAEKHIGDAVNATGLYIDRDVKAAIQRGPKTGVVYEKTDPKRTHQASAPGEAPATDTGALVSSVYFTRDGLSATVGSRLAYAYDLEFGRRKIKPRPAWMPATERARPELAKRVEEALRRAAQ